MGPRALQVALQRGGRAGHRVDLERDRQGSRRLGPRADATGGDGRLPAQSPDRRAAAASTADGVAISNSDPITGQAGWYDVRVRIEQVRDGRGQGSLSAFRAARPVAGQRRPRTRLRHAQFAGRSTDRSARNDDARSSASSSISISASAATPARRAARNGTPSATPVRWPTSDPYGADPPGTLFNRVQTYEVGELPRAETVHFPSRACIARSRRA